MKKITVLLAGILAVVIYIAVAQHNANEDAKRAAAKAALSECWHNAVRNGVGADLCKSLAEAINK